jgi:hypothetical protein
MSETQLVPTGQEPTKEISIARPEPLVITPQYIEQQKRSMALLQELVRDVLLYGRDYGKVPGIPDFLWDPGAQQIFGAFNVFPGHRRVIHFKDEDDTISIILEIPLIQRNTGAEVGSGIGASSTQEKKHKYRWEPDPENWGYEEESIKTLKTREGNYGIEYRIVNPERGELLNVITKQASKRGEVDAASSLPGVSSVLRELFSGKSTKGSKDGKQKSTADINDTSPKWTKFWGSVRALGIVKEDDTPDSDQVHKFLGVPSMKEWLAAGKSLDEAVKLLAMKVGKEEVEAKPGKKKRGWGDIVIGDVDTYDKLEKVFKELTGNEPNVMYRDLGGSTKNDMTMGPFEAFHSLKTVYSPDSIE